MKVFQLLSEANDAHPLELRDVVRFYPNTYKRVFNAKWGNGRDTGGLVFHGHALFSENDGEKTAYDQIEQAVDRFISNEDYRVEVNITIDLDDFEPSSTNDTTHFDAHDYSFDTEISDKQEVYLGYSPHDDALYIGYDAWIHEEEFNESWDKEFAHATGEMFDMDNPAHDAVFQKVWQKFRNEMFFGLLFRVTERNGYWEAEEVFAARPGGFYRGIYRGIYRDRNGTFSALDLIDLRLD